MRYLAEEVYSFKYTTGRLLLCQLPRDNGRNGTMRLVSERKRRINQGERGGEWISRTERHRYRVNVPNEDRKERRMGYIPILPRRMYRRQGMRSMINSRTTTRATFSSSFASSFVYSFAQCDLDVGSAKTLEPNTLLPEFPIRPRVTHLSSLRGNFESRFRFRFIAREHWFRRACKWYSLSKPVLRPTRVFFFFCFNPRPEQMRFVTLSDADIRRKSRVSRM